MESGANNKTIVTNFIEEIWNCKQFDKLNQYLHPDFVDHSLPPALPSNVEGLKLWVIGTGKSFEHKTVIEEILAEGDKVMVKMRMELKHIGVWREIAPTGAEIFTVGYRYFRMLDGRIIGHWALLDGNAIENQLKETSHGCKIQE